MWARKESTDFQFDREHYLFQLISNPNIMYR